MPCKGHARGFTNRCTTLARIVHDSSTGHGVTWRADALAIGAVKRALQNNPISVLTAKDVEPDPELLASASASALMRQSCQAAHNQIT